MTRQVIDLLLFYQYTFPLHHSQPHVYYLFNFIYLFIFSNTRYTHLIDQHSIEYTPQNPYLSLLGSQIYCFICLSLQYHHRFLSSSLKICRYHSKMLISMPSMNIQLFFLSQAKPILRTNLKKKDFIAKICPHHQQI